MPRLLLLATTTGYQTRAFGEAAARLGVELVFATDRCHLIDDPWQDQAIAIRFYDEDASVAAILESAAARPLDGLLVVGDRPTAIAARVAAALRLPWHSVEGAVTAGHKQLTRERLRAANLPVPWFVAITLSDSQSLIPNPSSPSPLSYPCVVKPVALSGSRGVMRVDDAAGLATALTRLQALMDRPEVRAERNAAHATALIEGFIPGREYALEGLLHRGRLQTLAIFDKPDPLDGPFFEETIYLTPSSADAATQRAIVDGVARAADAIGLHHGPVHAECRVNPSLGSGDAPQVFVLEVAARPIGGLCATALRFERGVDRGPITNKSAISNHQSAISLEEFLLRHALGEDPAPYQREGAASGVMMIPIPRRGIFRRVDGMVEAEAVEGVEQVRITAKSDQLLVPLPEGASYLGFIFARGRQPKDVDRALRAAHAHLKFVIDPEWPVFAPGHVHYNLHHG